MIEWRPIHLENIIELYLQQYLESFAANAFSKFLSSGVSKDDLLDSQKINQMASYQQIKNLPGLVSRCLTHPSSVSLEALDHLRRMLLEVTDLNSMSRDNDIRKAPAERVLQILQAKKKVYYRILLIL